MKAPQIIRLVLLVGLAAVCVWIARNTYWDEHEERTRPAREVATNPFYSVQHFAESIGARTQVRHEVISLPSTQAVIVATTGSWNWSLIASRRERLEKWVAAGGRLVVDEGLVGDVRLLNWAGVAYLPVNTGKRESCNCTPGQHCPVPTLGAVDEPGKPASRRYAVCELETEYRFSTARKVSWSLSDNHGHRELVRIPIGRGSVTLINAIPFGNMTLLCGDNALLFAAATQLRRGDEIYFLSEKGGAPLLLLMWSSGWPVVVLTLLLITLWLWRSGLRFGPLEALPDTARRSLAEQIRGTGQFTLRFGGGRALYTATARALREAAERHIAHYERLSGEERVAILARLTGLGSGELTDALDYSGPRRPNELRRAIAVLETARRAINNLKTSNSR